MLIIKIIADCLFQIQLEIWYSCFAFQLFMFCYSIEI